VLGKVRNFCRILRDPAACGTSAPGHVGVAYIPWWPSNPCQVRLKDELASMGVSVHDGALNRRTLLCLLLGRGPADVVHVHWPHGMYLGRYARYPFALLHLLLYRVLRHNVIWTVHELEFYETRYPALDRIMVRFLMAICRLLIVHSEYSMKLVRERYGFKRKVVYMPHPSYVGCYADDITPADARARLGLDQHSTVYLFLGHIKRYKGVESLIATFRHVDTAGSTLVIVGQPLDVETGDRIRASAA
jgi:glycosyltransferase involved in cell wall biosynthesis